MSTYTYHFFKELILKKVTNTLNEPKIKCGIIIRHCAMLNGAQFRQPTNFIRLTQVNSEFLNGAVTSITLYCIGGVFRCDHIPTTKMTEITINSQSKMLYHAYGTKFSFWFCGFVHLFLMGFEPILSGKSFLIRALFQIESIILIFS